VITGASKGLGRQMAESLAAAGAAVALVARSRSLLNEVAAGITAGGGKAEAIVADVSDDVAVADAAERVSQRLGTCDILVNNAGINNRKAVDEFTTEEWNEIVGVNLTAPFLMCREFVPGMKEKRWGRIINMTSIMSHISIPLRTGYSATKAGLLGMTKALALELAPYNITANGISPGPFATEMNKPILDDPERNAQFLSRIPAGRWGKVEEVGSLAVYLCSEEAGFITGTDIVIDGGWIAQ
jgi:NAD(P)-dependent dehydrogenase (short-subunit alcohol dehydrogenase family)